MRVELGEVSVEPNRRPTIPYKLTLRNDATLEGVLPFEWRHQSGRWEGVAGLDWHLQKDLR